MRSSFNGVIEEFPGIFVDNFLFPALYKPRAYFLSHTHKDHTAGLHDKELLDYLVENRVKIYMTELSASFVTYKDDCLKNHIQIIKLGSTLVTVPATSNNTESLINVKVIPAGHSCGSVMFMFETPIKRVLYTGDFRIDPDDLSNYRHFHNADKSIISIDTIYMDTTFISSQYDIFPKRSACVKQALVEIERWLDRDRNNRVGLDTSASTGYEYLFNEIYEKIGLKIYVDSERWKFYRGILHLVPAMTNEAESKIHLCHYTNKDVNHTKCLPPQIGNYNFLKLRFSAQPWKNYKYEQNVIEKVSKNHINVCFATHCSLSELKAFANYLAPKKIVGFPNEYVFRENYGNLALRKRKKLFQFGMSKKVCSSEIKRIMQF